MQIEISGSRTRAADIRVGRFRPHTVVECKFFRDRAIAQGIVV
jgi:hypothetical protein